MPYNYTSKELTERASGGGKDPERKATADRLYAAALKGDQSALYQLLDFVGGQGDPTAGNEWATADARNYGKMLLGQMSPDYTPQYDKANDGSFGIGDFLKIAAPIAGMAIPGIGTLGALAIGAGGSALGGALSGDKFDFMKTLMAGGAAAGGNKLLGNGLGSVSGAGGAAGAAGAGASGAAGAAGTAAQAGGGIADFLKKYGPAAQALLPLLGAGVGGAVGGGGPQNAQPVLPKDLQPMRAQNIGLMQYLLGRGAPPQGITPPSNVPMAPMPAAPAPSGPGNFLPNGQLDQGQIPSYAIGTPYVPQTGTALLHEGEAVIPKQFNYFGAGAPALSPYPTGGGTPSAPLPTSPPPPSVFPTATQPTPTSGNGANLSPPAPSPYGTAPDTAGRIESFFGQLGTPTTALQQQSLGGISQYLNSNPYGQSNTALQGILGGQGYNPSNQAYTNTGNANLYGGAQNAFNQLGQSNPYGNAQDMFSQLGNFNPFGAATSSLEGQLGTNPGIGMLEALRPYFERNLAQANQTGGRFGSSNAILNSRAVQDYNLLGAQALQQGIGQQQNAASILGMLGQARGGFMQGAGQGMLGIGQGQSQNMYNSGQGLLGVGQGQMNQGFGMAGGLGQNAANLGQQQLGAAGQFANNANGLFNNYQGAYNVGSQQAVQEAQRQQQALQIMQNLLGASFGATLGVDNQVSPTGAQQGAQVGGQLAQFLAALQGGGGQPGQQAPPAYQFPGGFGMPYGF
jgi:hypothetical protein